MFGCMRDLTNEEIEKIKKEIALLEEEYKKLDTLLDFVIFEFPSMERQPRTKFGKAIKDLNDRNVLKRARKAIDNFDYLWEECLKICESKNLKYYIEFIIFRLEDVIEVKIKLKKELIEKMKTFENMMKSYEKISSLDFDTLLKISTFNWSNFDDITDDYCEYDSLLHQIFRECDLKDDIDDIKDIMIKIPQMMVEYYCVVANIRQMSPQRQAFMVDDINEYHSMVNKLTQGKHLYNEMLNERIDYNKVRFPNSIDSGKVLTKRKINNKS